MTHRNDRFPLLAVLVGAVLVLGGCVAAPTSEPEGDPRVVAAEWSESTSGSAMGTAQCELDRSGTGLRPDPDCTPGAVTSEISAADTTPVCGAAAGADVEGAVRTSVLVAYGVGEGDHDKYEVDYLVPRELGGANDFANLWPIPLNDPAGSTKDSAERSIIDAVCGGRAGIQAAQFALASDWTTALSLLGIR